MKQLVKQRVEKTDPVTKLIPHFSIRHVTGTTTLNELGRILSRNGFALVDKTKFVTTSDLLAKISPVSPCCLPAKNDVPASGDGSNMLQLAAAAVIGMGVAAFGTFMMMNKNK